MILIPLFCLLLGVLVGVLIGKPLTGEIGVYVAVACLAGLDTICGGIRANLEGKFDGPIMVTGFLSNILIASALSWLGTKIGVEVFLVCAFIFGMRIFTNLSVIRRILLTKWTDRKAREAQERLDTERAQEATAAPSETVFSK
ncbi:MAG: small basic family protein [Fimbriimonadaceae bacterium]|nr:small basic family protein [Fimbriimonadaceae bacterium]